MMKTILVVDDEKRLVMLIKAYLTDAGFNVVTAFNGRDALFVARDAKPDLIVLDIMMPELDGHDFMRIHRKERNTPIILLTAKVEENDRILGLELGADDYVTKPFSPREIVARVKAVMRRIGRSDTPLPQLLRVQDLELDPDSYVVTQSNERIDLTRSEFDLLHIFMQSPGRAFSRVELLDKLQGTVIEGYERTIDVHIKNIRAKIEENPRLPRYIETVYGVGYRLIPT
jgi:DNA-binding response OmpR family regulator